MKPALAQICSLNSSFESDIADYAASGCQAIELWLGKLESYIDEFSLAEAKSLLAEHEMAAPVASFQGGLFSSQGEARQQHWNHFQQRLALCQELGVETLVVAADLTGPMTSGTFEQLCVSLSEAADQAKQSQTRLALEFQAKAIFANNLETAVSLIERVAHSHLGICLDLFHYYTGPSKTDDLRYLSPQTLFHVQLCDLSGVARELATDADRILPGDGDFMFEPLLESLRQIGYDGYVSIELMNPRIWKIPAREFGDVGMSALKKLLEKD